MFRPPDLVPALSTRAAIYSGIIATTVSPLPTTCGSANCTWNTVPTLGVCGECVPVNATGSCDQTLKMCNFTTPAGLNAAVPINNADNGIFTVAPTNGTVYQMNDTSRAYISVFDVLEVSSASGQSQTAAQAQAQAAWADECALWFCVQAINITIAEGIENQTVVANWSQTRLDYPSSAHGTEYLFEDIPAEFNVAAGASYVVTDDAMTALRNFVAPLMRGTVNSDVQMIDYSSDWIEAMWNATYDLPTWVANLALSMTNEVRAEGSGGGGDAYQGRAEQMAPFVEVQWLWMIYPATLIAASIYYLCSTILQGARDDISVWKSNALPMLFCRIDQAIHEKVGDAMDVPDGIDEHVGPTKVALLRNSTGEWTFRTAADRRRRL